MNTELWLADTTMRYDPYGLPYMFAYTSLQRYTLSHFNNKIHGKTVLKWSFGFIPLLKGRLALNSTSKL